MKSMDSNAGKAIKINFHQKNDLPSSYAVEKNDSSGKKRRYLQGIATGQKIDSHGERLTEECLKGLEQQANSGDVLLYADMHGIRESQDIGILVGFKFTPEGDWETEYRLYDENDGVDRNSVETADKLWKQVNGLPPYKRPRKKGFSIEGYIPPDKILLREEKQMIDGMVLQGVVVVPQPAYKDSVAHAIYKALEETPPWVQKNGIKARLRDKLVEQEAEQAYNTERWDIDNSKDDLIREIMAKPGNDAKERLSMVFEEYQELMIELILNSAALFIEDDVTGSESVMASPYTAGLTKAEVFSQIQAEVGRLAAIRGHS